MISLVCPVYLRAGVGGDIREWTENRFPELRLPPCVPCQSFLIGFPLFESIRKAHAVVIITVMSFAHCLNDCLEAFNICADEMKTPGRAA